MKLIASISGLQRKISADPDLEFNIGDTAMSWSFTKKAATKESVKNMVLDDPHVKEWGHVPPSVAQAMAVSIDALDEKPDMDIEIETYGHVYEGVGEFMIKVSNKTR